MQLPVSRGPRPRVAPYDSNRAASNFPGHGESPDLAQCIRNLHHLWAEHPVVRVNTTELRCETHFIGLLTEPNTAFSFQLHRWNRDRVGGTLASCIFHFMKWTYDWDVVHQEAKFPLVGPRHNGELGDGTGKLNCKERQAVQSTG